MISDLCIRFRLSGQSNYDAERFRQRFPFCSACDSEVSAFSGDFLWDLWLLICCGHVLASWIQLWIKSRFFIRRTLTRHLVFRRMSPVTTYFSHWVAASFEFPTSSLSATSLCSSVHQRRLLTVYYFDISSYLYFLSILPMISVCRWWFFRLLIA